MPKEPNNGTIKSKNLPFLSAKRDRIKNAFDQFFNRTNTCLRRRISCASRCIHDAASRVDFASCVP